MVNEDEPNHLVYTVDISRAKQEFKEICQSIEADDACIEEAWTVYEKLSQNITLEVR